LDWSALFHNINSAKLKGNAILNLVCVPLSMSKGLRLLVDRHWYELGSPPF